MPQVESIWAYVSIISFHCYTWVRRHVSRPTDSFLTHLQLSQGRKQQRQCFGVRRLIHHPITTFDQGLLKLFRLMHPVTSHNQQTSSTNLPWSIRWCVVDEKLLSVPMYQPWSVVLRFRYRRWLAYGWIFDANPQMEMAGIVSSLTG